MDASKYLTCLYEGVHVCPECRKESTLHEVMQAYISYPVHYWSDDGEPLETAGRPDIHETNEEQKAFNKYLDPLLWCDECGWRGNKPLHMTSEQFERYHNGDKAYYEYRHSVEGMILCDNHWKNPDAPKCDEGFDWPCGSMVDDGKAG